MTRQHLRVLCATAVSASLFAASVASGAPVAYNESVSGDLAENPSPSPFQTFTFDLGINTISGTIALDSEDPPDLDGFAFTIPAGLQLTAGGVTLADQTGNLINAGWEVRSGSANWNTGTHVDDLVASSPGSDSFQSSVLPLGANTYSVTQFRITAPSPGDTASGTYTFSFTVIPEPTTGALVLAGLATLSLARPSRRGRDA